MRIETSEIHGLLSVFIVGIYELIKARVKVPNEAMEDGQDETTGTGLDDLRQA